VGRWAETFGDVAPGELLLYTGSVGFVEIGVRDGSAARVLDLPEGVVAVEAHRRPR
jgi:S-adenosylmethionine hydrolase